MIIDLIHDIRYICTRLRTDGIKAMLHNFSGGKRLIKFANARNRRQICLLLTRNE